MIKNKGKETVVVHIVPGISRTVPTKYEDIAAKTNFAALPSYLTKVQWEAKFKDMLG